METCNSGRLLLKRNVYFITGMQFFLLSSPENEFLQTFRTITSHDNEEFTMKH